jgi:hypothetical protein
MIFINIIYIIIKIVFENSEVTLFLDKYIFTNKVNYNI